jgi:hypothetical protein
MRDTASETLALHYEKGVFSSSFTPHELFDFFCFNRDIGHEVGVGIFADEEIVFEADADAFFADVDAGLDGEEHAFGEGGVWRADIVNIESEMV